MSIDDHILPLDALEPWRESCRQAGQKLVVTNGCFDLLHIGHLRYLERASQLGDLLLVGINDDAGVAQLKGPGRPVNPQGDRAELIAGLRAISLVTIFPGTKALPFLEIAQPDVYVKGGDYELDSLDQNDRRFLEDIGASIQFIPLVPQRSTTRTITTIVGPKHPTS